MTLCINSNHLCYEYQGQLLWSIALENLCLIGEFTTANGPWFDDWFLVFAEQPREWREVPIEAVSEAFWLQLSHLLQQEIRPGLASSADWASRVLYPVQLAGAALFRRNSKDEAEPVDFTDSVQSVFR